MHTSIRIEGANCATCFNDVLDALRAAAGVRRVDSSISESWIDVDHDDDVGAADLVEVIRPHAHGIEMYANEIRMVALDPVTCDRHPGVAPRPPTD